MSLRDPQYRHGFQELILKGLAVGELPVDEATRALDSLAYVDELEALVDELASALSDAEGYHPLAPFDLSPTARKAVEENA